MEYKDCRKVVKDFAIQMEIILRENDHKHGWEDLADETIISRMLEEIGEIITEKACITGNSPQDEAVDLANYAMMLWDNITNNAN